MCPKAPLILFALLFTSLGFGASFNLSPEAANSTSGDISLTVYNGGLSEINRVSFESTDFPITELNAGGCELAMFAFTCEVSLKPEGQITIPMKFLANPGAHALSVTATDVSGNEFVFEHDFIVDLDKPIIHKVDIEYPGQNLAAKTGSSIILKVYAADRTGKIQSVSIGGSEIGCKDTVFTEGIMYWSGVCRVRASDGLKVEQIVVKDSGGNTAASNFAVLVDNTPSSINLIEYRNASRRGDTVKFSFNITEKGTPIRDVVLDTRQLGCSESHLSPVGKKYSSLCTVVADEGAYAVSIRAYDFAGNIDETTINFHVDNHAPIIHGVSFDYPQNQEYAKLGDSISLRLNASDGISGIKEAYANAEPIGCPRVAMRRAGGIWEGACNISAQTGGEFSIPVFALDKAGNMANSTAKARLDLGDPDSLVIVSMNSTRDMQKLKNGDRISFTVEAYDSMSGIMGVRVIGQGSGCNSDLQKTGAQWSGFCSVRRAAIGPKSIAIIAYDYANNTRALSIDIGINDTFCDKDCDIGHALNYTTCVCEKMECSRICPTGFNLDREKCECVPPKICSRKCGEGERLNTERCICEKIKHESVDYSWVIYVGIVIVILIPITFALNSKMIGSLKKYD